MQKVDFEILKGFFDSFEISDFSEELFNEFAARAHVGLLKKGEVLNKSGELWMNVGVVVKGLVRVYYRKNGKEVTEGFVTEGGLFSALPNTISVESGSLLIEAEEDTTYYSMSYTDVESMCCKFPLSFDYFYEKGLLATIKSLMLYTEILQLESADEKYEHFCNLYPTVVLRAPSIHIASCLGMTPETLSRVRSRVRRK